MGKVDSWALEPFKQFINRVEHLESLLRLTVIGISGLNARVRLIELIIEADPKSESDYDHELKLARGDAELATTEINNGFPLIHAQSTVGLWTLLEASIRSFLIAWLKNNPGAMQIDSVQRLKIRIGEYERYKGDDRYMFIVNLLEQEVNSSIRYGVERFERLLQLFDLSGELPQTLKQTLFEFAQIRNCIVHRSSSVDAQLIDACPWLNLKLGQEIIITRKVMGQYFHAATDYIGLIICRLMDRYGGNSVENRETIFKKWNKTD